jgi:serine protease AprX
MNNQIKNCIIVAVLLLFLSNYLFAQIKTYRVFFKDKGKNIDQKDYNKYTDTLHQLSNKALERRLKVLNKDRLVGYEDFRINPKYIDSIKNLNCKVLLKLKWKNYIVVSTDTLNYNKIKGLDFVDSIIPTSKKNVFKQAIDSVSKQTRYDELGKLELEVGAYKYGKSKNQLKALNIPILHKYGINGKGVLLGFLDTGFRWKLHESLKDTKVIEEYDFYQMDSNTANDEFDLSNQDNHGTATLSTVVGFKQDSLIGAANEVDILLGKTESMLNESHLEEDAYVAAIEWMEAKGVDIITGSLGYFTFDATDQNYIRDDLTGYSTLISKGVNDCVKRGVIFFTSAGNNGPGENTIITPGDADSAMTIGSLRADSKTVSSFSSRGKLINGKLKPDFVCIGEEIQIASSYKPFEYKLSNGTSFSTPILAGGSALILSLFPDLTPNQMRQSLCLNSSNKLNPTKDFGYGLPDLFKTAKSLGILVTPLNTYQIQKYQRVLNYLITDYEIPYKKLFVRFEGNQEFKQFDLYKTSHQYQYAADLPLELFNDKKAEAYLIVNDEFRTYRYPIKSGNYFEIEPRSMQIERGIDESELPKVDESLNNSFTLAEKVLINGDDLELNAIIEESTDISIKVYDALGKLILEDYLPQREKGILNYSVSTKRLSRGVYFLSLIKKTSSEIVKFLVN